MLLAWWLLRVALAVASRERLAVVRRSPGIWLVVPAAVAVALLAGATHGALAFRVYLSADALVRGAADLAAFPVSDLRADPARVGLFRVREFQRFDDELRFLTNECGVVDECGVIYSPGGEPKRRGEDSFTPLYGPWWHWYQSW